jgi:hypothetical protein
MSIFRPAPFAFALLLAACATDPRKPTEAERRGIEGVLAGEWVVPGNQQQYLLFKPDGTGDMAGRFGGIGDFDRYEIKGRLFAGRTVTVELISAYYDTPTPTVKATVSVAADGRSLNLVLPAGVEGKTAIRRTYRKVQW